MRFCRRELGLKLESATLRISDYDRGHALAAARDGLIGLSVEDDRPSMLAIEWYFGMLVDFKICIPLSTLMCLDFDNRRYGTDGLVGIDPTDNAHLRALWHEWGKHEMPDCISILNFHKAASVRPRTREAADGGLSGMYDIAHDFEQGGEMKVVDGPSIMVHPWRDKFKVAFQQIRL